MTEWAGRRKHTAPRGLTQLALLHIYIWSTLLFHRFSTLIFYQNREKRIPRVATSFSSLFVWTNCICTPYQQWHSVFIWSHKITWQKVILLSHGPETPSSWRNNMRAPGPHPTSSTRRGRNTSLMLCGFLPSISRRDSREYVSWPSRQSPLKYCLS